MTKKQYIFNSLILPLLFLVISVCIVFFLQKDFSSYYISKVFSNALSITNGFMLTFTGFLITAFTILQVLESKKWFDQMKKTVAFGALIWEMEFAILISIAFLLGTTFLIFFNNVASFVIEDALKQALSSLQFGAIVFIIFLSWKCIKSLIVLIRG